MITRCPECATAFHVSQAQLDARAGQVRCGHCGEVFDALAFLELEEAPPIVSPPGALPSTAVEQEPVVERPPIAPRVVVPAPELPAEEEPLPYFGPRPERRTRLWWGIAAGLLLIALNVQALFYFRGAIALVWPQARPYIESLCRGRCEIPLPKRAELMSIETSDLQAEPTATGVMALSATLRNRAAFPQAFPALELTLTDEHDQPLARRVLKPAEYLKRQGNDAIPSCAGGVASCEVQVRLFLEAAALKASGYRLYLFYP
jgi:predicted Zn finger-like uncharacterized protein